jgi:hypothetical protein
LLATNNKEKITQFQVDITAALKNPANNAADLNIDLLEKINGEITAKLQEFEQVTTPVEKKASEPDQAEIEARNAAFQERLKEIQDTAAQHVAHPKPETITRVEALWLEDREAEIERLKAIPAVAALFNHRDLLGHAFDRIGVGHSLELRTALQETHYVINHGQNSGMMCLGLFSRAFKRIFESQSYLSCFPLRHDRSSDKGVDFFLQQVRDDEYGDAKYSNEVICADVVFYNNERYESAYSFYSNDADNLCSSSEFMHTKLKEMASMYITDEETAEGLAQQVQDIFSRSSRHDGTLYSICIRKQSLKRLLIFQKLGVKDLMKRGLMKSVWSILIRDKAVLTLAKT